MHRQTELPAERFVAWIGIARGKFFDWRKRYGRVNEHNALIPRDHWLTDEEKQAIIAFHDRFPLEGYRRLTFMMIDQDVVAASASSVYRVLSAAGLLDRWNPKPSKKGTGFVQPLAAHEHWHIDVAYLNLGGTFYYRVERLMRETGLAARKKRRFRKTTDSNHPDPIAPNVLARNFNVALPDTAWVTDVTYIWTHEGWLYLAAILDLFSRRVVGWAASANNDRALALGACSSSFCGYSLAPIPQARFTSSSTTTSSTRARKRRRSSPKPTADSGCTSCPRTAPSTT